MFEAKLLEAAMLKKIMDSIKDLVNEASWDCSPAGMSLQAMDTSHVSLVAVNMRCEGFEQYRCDRNITLGMNLTRLVNKLLFTITNIFLYSLSKILKCAANDDIVVIKAPDDADKISLTFEAKNESETAEYEIKLMNLDSEYLVSRILRCPNVYWPTIF